MIRIDQMDWIRPNGIDARFSFRKVLSQWRSLNLGRNLDKIWFGAALAFALALLSCGCSKAREQLSPEYTKSCDAAAAMEQRGDFVGALNAYSKAAQIMPEEPTIYYKIARVAVNAPDPERGLAAIAKLTQLQGKKALLDSAVSNWQSVLQKGLDDYHKLSSEGGVKENQGDFSGAIADYAKAARSEPYDPGIYYKIARASVSANNVEQGLNAISILNRLDSRAKQDPDVLDWRATLQESKIQMLELELAKAVSAKSEHAESVFESISTHELLVTDSTGKGRLRLTSDSDGGVFKLLNSQGVEVARIEVSDQGNGIVGIMNEAGTNIAAIGSAGNGNGSMSISDFRGNSLAFIGANTSGNGLIKTMDAAGIDQVVLSSDGSGNGFLNITDTHGKSLAFVGANTSGNGLIKTMNAAGIDQVALSSDGSGNGFLNITDTHGKSLAFVGANTSGRGLIKTIDSSGNNQVVLSSDESGSGEFSIYNYLGKEIVGAGASKNSQGIIGVYDLSGNQLVSMHSTDGHEGFIQISDGSGNSLIQVDGHRRLIWSADFPGTDNGKAWPVR
jgi:tetratricopeptide (TPR) repeat protein